jgi:hypothetical protein
MACGKNCDVFEFITTFNQSSTGIENLNAMDASVVGNDCSFAVSLLYEAAYLYVFTQFLIRLKAF